MLRDTIEAQLAAEGVSLPGEGPAAPQEGPHAAPQAPGNPLAGLVAFLTKKSPARPVSDYVDHPLNWRRDPDGQIALAQIIRGVTGWLGDLNFCLVDVVMGYLRLAGAGRTAGAGPGA